MNPEGTDIEKVIGAPARAAAAVWRMCGSPRIWGDAWVWAGLTGAYTWWRRFAGRWAAMIGLGGAVVIVVTVVLAVVATREPADRSAEFGMEPTPTPTPGPDYLTEIEALPLAVTSLMDNGFVGDAFSHIARRVQFRDYAAAIGQAYQAEEGHLEAPPGREVWVFAFKGDVMLDIPGQPSVAYDNLTVVLDALTGDVLRAEAFYGDFESPLRAPVWLRVSTPTPAPE